MKTINVAIASGTITVNGRPIRLYGSVIDREDDATLDPIERLKLKDFMIIRRAGIKIQSSISTL